MLARFSGHDRMECTRADAAVRHRDHFDVADVDTFDPRYVRVHRSGDADAGDTRVHELANCAEGLDVQP